MSNLPIERKIIICKSTRSHALRCLKRVLEQALHSTKPVVEAEFRDQLLHELRTSAKIYPDGWYEPPPQGVAVLFGTDAEGENCRVNFGSLREKKQWPREDVFLDRQKGIIYVYLSPIDKKTAIIGDFTVTLYVGHDPEIKKHLITCYKINKKIADSIRTGMSFSEISAISNKLLAEHGLKNEIVCKTSPSFGDLGHLVPGTGEGWSRQEKEVIESGQWEKVKETISKKRVFVRAGETYHVKPGVIFTIEPRPTAIGNSKLPMASFHSFFIVHEDGKTELFTGFEGLFGFAGD